MSKTNFLYVAPPDELTSTLITDTFLDRINNAVVTGEDIDGSLCLPYAIAGGAADAYTLTLTFGPDTVSFPQSYIDGQMFWFVVPAGAENTGASTLNINAISNLDIKKNFNQDLEAGDLQVGQMVVGIVKGTDFQMISPATAAKDSFRATPTALQNFVGGVSAKVLYATEVRDTTGTYDAANSKFVAPNDGTYLFSAALYFNTVVTANSILIDLYVNGVVHSRLSENSIAPNINLTPQGSLAIELSAADYVEIYASSANAIATIVSTFASYFTGIRLAE